MIAAIVGLFFLAPFLTLGAALVRAALLFWPTMLFIGAVHNDVFDWVPALSAWQTFLVVALVGLVLPSGTNASSND